MQETIIIADPLSKFPDAKGEDLLAACGFLAIWIINRPDDQTMKESLLANYPYYMGEMTGGTLLPDGRYDYPEDTTLYPLVSFTCGTEACFVYQYGIVGISTPNGETWVTRMD